MPAPQPRDVGLERPGRPSGVAIGRDRFDLRLVAFAQLPRQVVVPVDDRGAFQQALDARRDGGGGRRCGGWGEEQGERDHGAQ
ncbi:hypothetical protein AB5I41_21820 [Sphingomonas sp. MMS24-JH45]